MRPRGWAAASARVARTCESRSATNTGANTTAEITRSWGHGFHDVREAERLLLDAAAEQGLGHDSIEIEGRPWLETDINAGLGPS